MSASRPALPRPSRQKSEPTNIRLEPGLKQKAAEIAVERYGWPLTGLVRALLMAEVKGKRGLIPMKER